MSAEKEAIWYAFSGMHYSGNMPAFFPSQESDALNSIIEQRQIIKEELSKFLNKEANVLPSYFNKSLIAGDGNWDVLHFIRWGEPVEKNQIAFPRTAALLNNVPGITSAAITRLGAHTSILPHEGDTNAIIRCHLGLHIPAGLPLCGMEIKNEATSWYEDKWFFFCDAHEHRAWNNSEEDRIVIIADIIHPSYSDQINEVCNNVRSALELQRIESRFPIVKYLPGMLRGLLRRYFKHKVKLR
jgi:ornithine lipid ester-linked acyl 2-hydroxylase